MYSVDGNFGKVRIVSLMPSQQDPHLFSLYNAGWHKCNDQYHIARPNGSEYHLLLFTVKGKGTLRLNGVKHDLLPGTVAFLPRNTQHSYFTPSGGLWEFYWLHPFGDVAAALLDAVAQKGHFLEEIDLRWAISSLNTLIALCTERPPEFEWKLSQIISEVLHEAAIALCGSVSMPSLSRRAITYLERHFHQSVPLDTVAQELFVSTAHLIRTFKKETGRTPHQYLVEYRLMIAAQLLEFSDRRVDEIAKEIGFSSPSHFISNFKAHFGCTPLQYRELVSTTELE